MSSPLKIEFIPSSRFSSALHEIIDRVDHLAFAGEISDPEIKWAGADWMCLGRLDGEIVTQLGLLTREIRVGALRMPVVGIGGVATHPAWQRHGLATKIMQAAARFMQDEMNAPFGLLVCEDKLESFYARLGWQTVADHLWHAGKGKLQSMQTKVMILPILKQEWPEGEIDLCGLPW